MAAETPALVLGAGINGLGVARSLAHADVTVWLADTDGARPEMHTRAAKPMSIAALHGDALVDELVRLGTSRFSGVRPVLLLTQEESVKTVSRARERLSELYRFSLPPKEVVDALLNKYGFQQLAERFDCRIPALVHVTTPADLPSLQRLDYPVVVKPGERHAEYARRFRKAYRVENAADAIDLVRRILPVMADIVVQEWTEGPDANIYFCLQYLDPHGEAIASFTGRKVRSWPPQVGGTASCVPAPEAAVELAESTTNFFRKAGAVGMAAMEYKRDARSGEFRMVEPTIGRTDYQAEVATLNGINLPYAAYCAELGLPVRAVPTPTKRRAWRVRSEDVQSAAAQHQRVGAGFVGVDGVVDALWRASDPLPWVMHRVRAIRRALKRRSARALPRSQPAGSKP